MTLLSKQESQRVLKRQVIEFYTTKVKFNVLIRSLSFIRGYL